MVFDVVMPIFGFEENKAFELEKIDDIFFKLKSVDGEVNFTLINPYSVRDYEFEIEVEQKAVLGVVEGANILVLNLMIVNTPLEESTVNFASPLIFNFDTNKMGQVILNGNSFGLVDKLKDYME